MNKTEIERIFMNKEREVIQTYVDWRDTRGGATFAALFVIGLAGLYWWFFG